MYFLFDLSRGKYMKGTQNEICNRWSCLFTWLRSEQRAAVKRAEF